MRKKGEKLENLGLAEKLGVGSADTASANRIQINEPGAESGAKFRMSGKVKKLAAFTKPEDACSACYGSLIHALARLDENGMLRRGKTPVAIGQGYRGKEGTIGVGRCTNCFEKSLGGCPPTAAQMLAFLEENWA